MSAASAAALALRLIERNGRQITIKKVAGVASNPSKPWEGSTAPDVTLGAPMAAFIPYKGFEFGTDVYTDELITAVDEVCMVSGAAGNFDEAHKIVDEGKEYRVQWARRLRPGSTTVLYAFGINR